MSEEKRNENRGDADWNEPFIADVTRRMKHESFRRQLVIELFDQRSKMQCPQAVNQAWRSGVREGPGRSVLPNRQTPFRGRYQSALARQICHDRVATPPVHRLSSAMSSAPRKCCDGRFKTLTTLPASLSHARFSHPSKESGPNTILRVYPMVQV